jgi:FtsH-binding integral membrane protein
MLVLSVRWNMKSLRKAEMKTIIGIIIFSIPAICEASGYQIWAVSGLGYALFGFAGLALVIGDSK